MGGEIALFFDRLDGDFFGSRKSRANRSEFVLKMVLTGRYNNNY